MQKFEKQQKIDELLEQFIDVLPYEDEHGNSRDSNSLNSALKDITSKVCNTLKEVLEGEYFMPRYYTLSNRLMEKETCRIETYDVPSRVRNLIQKSQGFLSALNISSPETKKDSGLKAYCQDKNFRHSVDEFYSSVLHEVLIYEANVSSKKAFKATGQIDSKTALMQDTLDEFADIKNDVENMSSRIDAIVRQVQDVTKNSNDTLKEAKNIMPNLLTIIGIFVAIIIAIVGIYLSIVLNDNSSALIIALFVTDSIWARIIFITLLGALIFNMLFVFLFWISKLSGRTIGCSCIHGDKCTKCDKKEQKCGAFRRVWKRYWNFIIFNAIIAIVIGVSLYNHWNLLNDTQKEQFINNTIIETTLSPTPAVAVDDANP